MQSNKWLGCVVTMTAPLLEPFENAFPQYVIRDSAVAAPVLVAAHRGAWRCGPGKAHLPGARSSSGLLPTRAW